MSQIVQHSAEQTKTTEASGYTGSEDQEHRKSLVILVSWTWQVS